MTGGVAPSAGGWSAKRGAERLFEPSIVNTGPRLPGALVKSAPDIYIRFHGRRRWYRHDYQKAELADWVERIRASGAERVWAYFNNDREGYAILNARQLLRMLKAGHAESNGG